MNIKPGSCLSLFLAAATMVATAHATSFTGTVYNLPGNGTVQIPSTLGTALGTFTVDSFNFFADGSKANPYTVGGFLSGGSNLVIGSSLASLSLGSKEILFEGSTYLIHGDTYTFTHDDGMVLLVSGSPVIYSPSPTVAEASSFTFTGTTGINTFDLAYGENALAPADLKGPFTAVTPEPSSIMLLGTGLLGMAGLVRRRIKACASA